MSSPLRQWKWKLPSSPRFLHFSALALAIATASVSLGLVSVDDLARHTAALISNSKKKPAPLVLRNWGLDNTFQSHILVRDAWKITEGSSSVIVAVIDTGIDSKHPALTANLWRDPAISEKAVYGWNFVTNEPNPTDDHGHGTHVAGIIGAVTQPEIGVSGVAQKVSIMAIKYYSEKNPGAVNLKNTVRAIDYAVEHGAKIINYSGGGPEFSEEEYLAIRRAEAKGVLFVSAAGNERKNTDLVENYYFPSAYGLSNIISVAATDVSNKLIASSNWGKKKVEIAAPGEGIFSTLPGGRYGTMTGTSQATAFVSGVAALLLSKNPSLTPQQLKSIILSSADRIPELAEKIATSGRLNAFAALTQLNQLSSEVLLANQPSLQKAAEPSSQEIAIRKPIPLFREKVAPTAAPAK
ncbi:MAG: hypothetical protein RJB38_2051 [Pseudomonadota bacterium]|jgi:subtilisin family serine protease